MRRDPSLHIVYTDLKRLLREIGVADSDNVAEQLMRKAVPFSVKERYLVKGDYTVRKKANKLIEASKGRVITVEKFNQLLVSSRLNEGHMAITTIRKGDSQYATLVEVSQLCSDFCTAFDFSDINEGARIYINLGMKFMKYGSQFAISKFKYYNAKINSYYESAVVIKTDPKPMETEEVYEIWKKLLLEYAALDRELIAPEDYVKMVFTRTEADLAGATYRNWLTAQFDILSNIDVVPNLNQLFGDNALKRYWDYMANANKKFVKKKELTFEEQKDDFITRYRQNLRGRNAEK